MIFTVWTCVVPGGFNNKDNDGKSNSTTTITKYGSASLNISGLDKVLSITEEKKSNIVDKLFGLINPNRSLVISEIATVNIEVYGLNFDAPISQTCPITNGNATATINNIPVGVNRVVKVVAKNSNGVDINGAVLKAVVDIFEGGNTLTVNWSTTPLGDVFGTLVSYDKTNGTEYSKTVNASDVATFIEQIKSSQTITHPSLGNGIELANKIIANGGKISADPANSVYRITPASLDFTFSDYVGGDIRVTVDDPASVNMTINANGTFSLTEILPGSGRYLIVRQNGMISNVYALPTLVSGMNNFATPVTPGIPVSITAIEPDSGFSNTDFMTNVNTNLKVKGTTGSKPNIKVIVGVDAVENSITSDATGNWEYTIPGTLTDGDHEVKVRAIDESAPYKPEVVITKLIKIDTTLPQLVVNFPIDNDTVTASMVMSGTISDINGISSLSFDLENTTSTTIVFTGKVITLPTVPDTNWSFNGWIAGDLVDGNNYKAIIKCTDKAGNISQTIRGFAVVPPPTAIYVSSTTGNNANSGFTAATSVKSIALGVAKAITNGIKSVKVASGTYSYNANPADSSLGVFDSGNNPLGMGVLIKDYIGSAGDPLFIEGGWDVTFASMSGTTILTGDGANFDSVIKVENSKFVTIKSFMIEKGGKSTTDGGGLSVTTGDNLILQNLTIKNNTALNGGGLYISNSTNITLMSDDISSNIATNGGGLYVNQSGNVTINMCPKIGGNEATANGGGIYLDSLTGRFEVMGSVTVPIQYNKAQNGGGIYVNNCTVNAGSNINALLEDNNATQNGGAVYFNNSDYFKLSKPSAFVGANIRGNKANLSNGTYGVGGIYLSNSKNIEILGNVIDNNFANPGGKDTAIYLDATSLVNINNNDIRGVVDGWKAEKNYFGIYADGMASSITNLAANKFDTDTMLNFLNYNGSLYNNIRSINTTFSPTMENSISGQLIDKDGGAVFMGLAALFNFDMNYNDQWGGADGTVIGTLDYTDNIDLYKRGYSADFQGSQYITITDANAAAINFSNSQDYTISFWVRVATDAPDGSVIISKGSTNYPYCFYYSSNSIVYKVNYSSPVDCSQPISTGQWYHVVAIKEGTKIVLSVDGGQNFTDPPVTFAGSTSSSDPVTIGADSSGSSKFKGLIDDIRIYNRPLSVSELTKLRSLYGPSGGPTNYLVTFNSNGGTPVTSQNITSGGLVTPPSNPTKSGFVFGGWYKEPALTTPWIFATDTVTAAITLYAKWTAPFGGGDGTSLNPYIIATAVHLNNIRPPHLAPGIYFSQTANIDLLSYASYDGGKGWLPIGSSVSSFDGNYNGNGYKISNLTINRTSESNIGLFGNTNGATIKNVTLENVNVTGSSQVGSLIGIANNSNTGKYIDNCRVLSGNVTSLGNDAGGLIGQSFSSEISKSFVNAIVSGAANNAGGLVAYLTGGKISESFTNGEVKFTADAWYLGGLVGLVTTSADIRNCYSTSKVTGASGSQRIGGLIGKIDTSLLLNSYSVGLVTGGSGFQGAIIGESSSSTQSGNYYNSETSGAFTGLGTPKTTAEMKDIPNISINYTGWNFTTTIPYIWGIDGIKNSGYPFLIGVTP